ncbi:MAG: aminomethyltransferase family protein [Chloroflexota bacterium]
MTDFHRSNGARFHEAGGWLLPSWFGDPGLEYHTVRSNVGLIDLSHRALLQFTGPDRLSFLQGMLSNDLRALKPFEGQQAAILTQQGKVIADVRVLCAMNSFYLDFWANLKEKVVAHLNRYLVADEVEIADRSDEYAILSVQGPRSAELIRTLAPDALLPAQPKQHAMMQIDGAAVCVVRDSQIGEAGYDLIIPVANLIGIAARLTHAGKPFSVAWIGTEAENILRVEAGTPRYGVDFNEDNLLLEVGLDNAVSFTKGCYLGQEVVERIRSRGHVNKKLCGLSLEGNAAVAAGDKIAVEHKEIGFVTSSVVSPELGRVVALGYVAREHWDPGTEVSIEAKELRRRAIVTALPFLSSSSS